MLVTEDRPFSSNYTARLVEVQGLAADVAKSMLREAVQDADEVRQKMAAVMCTVSCCHVWLRAVPSPGCTSAAYHPFELLI